MTYCLAISVVQGLVFASDSRINAGADQVSAFSKMHAFGRPADRALVVLTSGNLATSQAVIRRMRRDEEEGSRHGLHTVETLAEAAEHVGKLSAAEQKKQDRRDHDAIQAGASFIVGGQIGGGPHEIFQVHPHGNHIHATSETPYLQIGEIKYGRPLLDRIITDDVPLDLAAKAAIMSMEATLRCNANVGPPVELATYRADSLAMPSRLFLPADDDLLRTLGAAWREALQRSLEALPDLPDPG